jgi:4-amino-4-deoxy-L-arabinose transferase-like glycosyltransferase
MIGIAVLLRLASALFQGDTVVDMPGVNDQLSYDALARRVLAGNGFSFGTDWWPATSAGAPTAHWSYLYTLYLTAVYSVFGIHPVVARVLQAILVGVLYPLFAWRLGRRLFGTQVGLVSAALISVYIYFIYYAGSLMTEAFYILAVLWALDLTLDIGAQPAKRPVSIAQWLRLGLALALAVLLRQLLLLVVPVLGAWLLWTLGLRRWRSTLAGLAVVAFVIGVFIAPWTVRNYQAFGRFVLLNTNAGYAFFWGNHPIQGMNFISILPDKTYHELIPQELRSLDEAALDAALMQRGFGFVIEDPVRYVVLSLSRTKDYLEFWPSTDSGLLSNISRVLSFGLYLPFMVYGIWRTARGQTIARTGGGRALMLLYAFVGMYSLIHLLSWALVRYRLPVDAVLMPFAALGLLQLTSAVKAAHPLPTPKRQEA